MYIYGHSKASRVTLYAIFDLLELQQKSLQRYATDRTILVSHLN